MPSFDFSDYAQPLLDQLVDDPEKDIPQALPRRVSYPNIEDLVGELRPLSPDQVDTLDSSEIISEVSNDAIEAAKGAYPMAGVDVLAFYKSFRFKNSAPFPGKWGIFLLDAGVVGLASDLMATDPRLSANECHRLAMDLLLAHERYHFWIDSWALGQEITPYAKPRYKQYAPYLAHKKSVELTRHDWEESLANYYAFQKLKRRYLSSGVTANQALQEILDNMPVPYSNYQIPKYDRVYKEGVLAITIANGINPIASATCLKLSNIDPSVLSASIKPAEPWHPISGHANCPIYYVHTANYLQLVQPFQGPDLVEYRRYVTSYLDGQFLEHTDHDYYRIDNKEKVKIPNPHDKTVRGYELKGTLHKAGMTHKEFLQARQSTKGWTRNCPRSEPKPPRSDSM